MPKPEVENLNEVDFILWFKEKHATSYEYRRKVGSTDVLHREDGKPASHLVCDCGKVTLDEYRVDGALHHLDGPAANEHEKCCTAPEQEAIYAFWGINVPKAWTKKDGLTVKNILEEKNTDVQAVGLRAFGIDAFVKTAMDEVLEIDQGTTLTRALVKTKDGNHWMVCTDGSTKSVYTLRVPNTTKTCCEAYSALTNNTLKDENKIAEG